MILQSLLIASLSLIVLLSFCFPDAARYKIVIKIRLRKEVVCKNTFSFVMYIYIYLKSQLKNVSLGEEISEKLV